MRIVGVFTALALSGVLASCAERMVSPRTIPKPAPKHGTTPKPRLSNVEARRQTEKIAEDVKTHSAIRFRQANPSVGPKEEQPPQTEAQSPQASQQRQATPARRAAVAVPPPITEPDESNFPFEALMPPPPEPAEPTFHQALPTVNLPTPAEPATPTLPEVPIEAAMPPPPEAAQPSFPVAALMPPPPEPAEPSLPTQGEIIAESPISIPFPDLVAYLSLRPRFDWVDTVGAIDLPRGPVPETSEVSPERHIPTLIQSPWPLP